MSKMYEGLQSTDKEKRVADISDRDIDNYTPLRGDKIFVDPILDRYENRVSIKGAVFRPGDYELINGLTLKQLVEKADGLKEDALMTRGYITRFKPDNTQEIITFNLQEVMNNNSPDIILKREDAVTIISIFDLKENPQIQILGAVRQGGTLPLLDGMTVQDAIAMAGGFAEGANMQRVEVARRVKDSDRSKRDADLATVFQINIDKDLTAIDGFKLEPFDIISVYNLPGYEIQQNVKVDGEVMYPGNYTLLKKNERISDVLKRAGDFTPFAYLEGASLKRANKGQTNAEKQINVLKQEQREIAQADALGVDHTEIANTEMQNNFVGIDLNYILKHPRSNQDLILEDGDILTIPKLKQTIKVSGEVLLPSTLLYESGKSLNEYIMGSGGYSQNAYKKGTRVVASNGKAARTRSALFFKRYPAIKPGSEIYVPRKKDNTKEGLSAEAWIGMSTSLASLAAIVFAMLNSKK